MSNYFGIVPSKDTFTYTQESHDVKPDIDASSNDSVHDVKLKKRKRRSRQDESARKMFRDDCIGWNLPFAPHKVQRDMITIFLETARSGCNAIIDSPTGTGKTLALLSGGLRYHEELRTMLPGLRRDMNESQRQKKKLSHLGITVLGSCYANAKGSSIKRIPPIYYCSRTHSQLQQVIKELQYLGKKDVHMNILASRDHYCINERVRTTLENRSNNLGEMCDKAVLQNQCNAWDNYEEFARTVASVPHEWQIEDLVQNGKATESCPYYAARELIFNSYINFCPYNYILDPIIRHETKIEGVLRDAIIILDEAHNIDEVSRSSLEWQWKKTDLNTVVEEMKEFAEGDPVFYSKMSLTEKPEKCSEMSSLVRQVSLDLLSLFEKPWSAPTATTYKETHHGSTNIYYSKDIQDKIGIVRAIENNQEKQTLFASTLRSFLDFGVTFNTLDIEVHSVSTIKQTLLFLHLFLFRKSAFSLGINFEKAYIEIYCADSSLALKLLEQDVRSIILSSGTLPATDYLSKELGIPIEKEVRCGHVVDVKKAIFARIINSLGKFMYSTMYETNVIDRVGKLLVQAVNSTTHGRLCFFPSYRCLEVYWNRWSATRVRRDIENSGIMIFQEPRNTKSFGDMLSKFRSASKNQKGALLLAVFRGKASEGIDFKDNMARLIVSIGIPYRSMTDNRTIVKQKFNSESSSHGGNSWYKTDAVTAVNQAIGRCIRHQNDFGVLLLLDERWSQKDLFDLLPKWLRGAIHISDDSDRLFSSMDTFLKARSRETNVKEVEYIEVH